MNDYYKLFIDNSYFFILFFLILYPNIPRPETRIPIHIFFVILPLK